MTSQRKSFVFAVPGRVNLIGEHTDYNGGMVLPFAIEEKIEFFVHTESNHSENNLSEHNHFVRENGLTIFSENTCETFQFKFEYFAENIKKKRNSNSSSFENYCTGAVVLFDKASGENFCHFLGKNRVHIKINSTLPQGAGLSSSAALCTGLLMVFNELLEEKAVLTREDIVKIAQKIEHEYVGTMCGLMDQIAVVFAKENSFVNIDFLNLSKNFSQGISLLHAHTNFNEFSFVLFNTNVSHKLAETEYNTRRLECEKALKILNEKFSRKSTFVSEFLIEDVQNSEKDFENRKVFNRALHVVTENMRVQKSMQALRTGDLELLSECMKESHKSLNELYEVSCLELNTACEVLQDFVPSQYLLGPRMTGGGFGGSVVCGVHHSWVQKVLIEFSSTTNNYTQKTGIIPKVFVCKPSEGARKL